MHFLNHYEMFDCTTPNFCDNCGKLCVYANRRFFIEEKDCGYLCKDCQGELQAQYEDYLISRYEELKDGWNDIY